MLRLCARIKRYVLKRELRITSILLCKGFCPDIAFLGIASGCKLSKFIRLLTSGPSVLLLRLKVN